MDIALDSARFLDRIGYRIGYRSGYSGTPAPTLETLRAMQAAHLLAVPFENLNVARGWPISLEMDALFAKIAERRRGGFCYELNGLFAGILDALGFRVARLSAGVAHADGGFGPPFDHLALLVWLEEPWLVDVGFGDSARLPLRLETEEAQEQEHGSYRIARDSDQRDGDARVLLQRTTAGDWEPQYRFLLTPHPLADFAAMCHYHQTSPESPFTRKRVCTRATPDGRVTLSDLRLIRTAGGARTEEELPDEAAWDAALRLHFGIALD